VIPSLSPFYYKAIGQSNYYISDILTNPYKVLESLFKMLDDSIIPTLYIIQSSLIENALSELII
jgi:hypothetical protein